jgi:hypothetical protein
LTEPVGDPATRFPRVLTDDDLRLGIVSKQVVAEGSADQKDVVARQGELPGYTPDSVSTEQLPGLSHGSRFSLLSKFGYVEGWVDRKTTGRRWFPRVP